jgi:hypothetical protein
MAIATGQLRLLLLPQHFHAGSQFIPGQVQYSSAGVYLSNGGRPHSSMGVLKQQHPKRQLRWCCCFSTSMLDRNSYREKFSIRRPEFSCPMVDDRTRSWECWSPCCNCVLHPLLQVDQHSHVGWQFVPDGVPYSLAGVSSSNGGRLHSRMGVLISPPAGTSGQPAAMHVSTPKLDVWTALHVRQTFVLGEKGK